jgi:hypothetical protein
VTTNDLDQSPSGAGRQTAHYPYLRRLTVGVVAALAVAGTAYTAASASTPNHQPTRPNRQPTTPDQCIRLNGGDYNACNVGNSGRGDLPYQPVG